MQTVSANFARVVSTVVAALMLSAVCVGGAVAPAQSFPAHSFAVTHQA